MFSICIDEGTFMYLYRGKQAPSKEQSPRQQLLWRLAVSRRLTLAGEMRAERDAEINELDV